MHVAANHGLATHINDPDDPSSSAHAIVHHGDLRGGNGGCCRPNKGTRSIEIAPEDGVAQPMLDAVIRRLEALLCEMFD